MIKICSKQLKKPLKEVHVLFNNQFEKDRCKGLMDSLTPRELEILRYVIRGKLNKQIASELNIAEHTVKLHRGQDNRKTWSKIGPGNDIYRREIEY